jgi:hypothetical protein
MGTSVSLQTSALAVDPGQVVTTELRVRNTGDVVDQFSFQPLGDAAAWITVEPPVVRLFPDSDEMVTVSIAPPRDSSSPPGPATWAVKAIPQEDPGGAAVAEGVVEVGTFIEIGAELQPITGTGRFTGRFDVAIDNRGNVAVPVRLAGTDAEQSLSFEFDQAQIDTEPGSAHFAKLRIKPGKKIWRGQPKNHPFQVIVEPQMTTATPETDDELPPAPDPDAPQPIVLNGNLLQQPIIPKWLLKAIIALIALIIALWIIWKTLLKPEVESAAREIAIEEVAEIEEQVAEIAPAVEEATQQAEAAQQTAEQAEETAGNAQDTAEAAVEAGGGGDDVNPGSVLNSSSLPHFVRLAPGQNFVTNDDQTFAITDFILQNPRGGRGDLTVSVNGALVLRSATETFRDLDFHFVAPYVVQPGNSVDIGINCFDPGCEVDVAASVSGFLTTVTEEPAG